MIEAAEDNAKGVELSRSLTVVLRRRVHRLQRRAGAAGQSNPGRAAASRAGQAAPSAVVRARLRWPSAPRQSCGSRWPNPGSRCRRKPRSSARWPTARPSSMGCRSCSRNTRWPAPRRPAPRSPHQMALSAPVPADGGAAQSARRFPPAAGALRVWVEAIWRRDRAGGADQGGAYGVRRDPGRDADRRGLRGQGSRVDGHRLSRRDTRAEEGAARRRRDPARTTRRGSPKSRRSPARTSRNAAGRPARIRLATAAETAASPAPNMRPPRMLGDTGEQGEFVLPLNVPTTDGKTLKTDDFTFEAASWTLTAHEVPAWPRCSLPGARCQRLIARALFLFDSANVEGMGLCSSSSMQPFLPPTAAR